MGDFERLFENHASLAGLSQFASFLDEELDAAAVLRYLQDENSGFSGRKEFCEILGIGESTLSGWLKGDRIPKMAKLVIGLLKARVLDREALEQEEKRVEQLKIRDRIVKDGDRYMIVEFASNDGIGRVVARDIRGTYFLWLPAADGLLLPWYKRRRGFCRKLHRLQYIR